MLKFKKISVLLCLFLFMAPGKLVLSKGLDISGKLTANKSYYENSAFSIQDNNLNLIINNINSHKKSILIDTYFLNTSDKSLKTISNFSLIIKDENNDIIVDAIFPTIPIDDGLECLQGKKVILSLPKEKESHIATLKDMGNIYYEFTYNYTLK